MDKKTQIPQSVLSARRKSRIGWFASLKEFVLGSDICDGDCEGMAQECGPCKVVSFAQTEKPTDKDDYYILEEGKDDRGRKKD